MLLGRMRVPVTRQALKAVLSLLSSTPSIAGSLTMPNSPTCAAASIRLELVEVNITETSSAAPRMGPILRHVVSLPTLFS